MTMDVSGSILSNSFAARIFTRIFTLRGYKNNGRGIFTSLSPSDLDHSAFSGLYSLVS